MNNNDDPIGQFLDDSYNDDGEDDLPIHPPMVVDRSDIKSEQHDTVKSNVKDDYEFVRTNIKQIIETNVKGLSGLAKVAQESESPRAYEVLSTFMKQMLEANETLITLHKNVNDLISPGGTGDENPDEDGKGETHNHFYGTTEEFLEMLEKAEANKVTIDGDYTETSDD